MFQYLSSPVALVLRQSHKWNMRNGDNKWHNDYRQLAPILACHRRNTQSSLMERISALVIWGKEKKCTWHWLLWYVYDHDDVIIWKHFRVTGPLCGEFTGPGEFPTQRPVTRSFDVFFDLRLNIWLNSWANNREACDLRRHRGHYDVNVMHWLLWYVYDNCVGTHWVCAQYYAGS